MIFDTIKYKSYNRDTISFIVFYDIYIFVLKFFHLKVQLIYHYVFVIKIVF